LQNQTFFAPPNPRFRQIATKPLPAAPARHCGAGVLSTESNDFSFILLHFDYFLLFLQQF